MDPNWPPRLQKWPRISKNHVGSRGKSALLLLIWCFLHTFEHWNLPPFCFLAQIYSKHLVQLNVKLACLFFDCLDKSVFYLFPVMFLWSVFKGRPDFCLRFYDRFLSVFERRPPFVINCFRQIWKINKDIVKIPACIAFMYF